MQHSIFSLLDKYGFNRINDLILTGGSMNFFRLVITESEYTEESLLYSSTPSGVCVSQGSGLLRNINN